MKAEVCYHYTKDGKMRRCLLCVDIHPEQIKIWGHPHQCMSGIPVCWRCAETITEYMNKLKENKNKLKEDKI